MNIWSSVGTLTTPTHRYIHTGDAPLPSCWQPQTPPHRHGIHINISFPTILFTFPQLHGTSSPLATLNTFVQSVCHPPPPPNTHAGAVTLRDTVESRGCTSPSIKPPLDLRGSDHPEYTGILPYIWSWADRHEHGKAGGLNGPLRSSKSGRPSGGPTWHLMGPTEPK